jgi:Fe-S oxidoreductase
MKAEFLSLYHERYPRPLRDFLIASLEPLLKTVGRFALALNYIFASRVIRWILNHWVGLMDLPQLGLNSVQKGYKLRKLGRFSPDSLSRLSDFEKAKTVLIVQDSFTTFFEPEVVLGVTDLLLTLGYRPVLVPFFSNGKALHVKGFLRSFTALARRNSMILEKAAALGISLVGIEPAVTLTYRDEYVHALGTSDLPFKVQLLQEWLFEKLDQIQESLAKTRGTRASAQHYTLFSHCTEKTAVAASQKTWQQVFSAFGLNLTIAEIGCCGMCGIFGHEKTHCDESRGIYEMSWKPRLALAERLHEKIVVTGFSCRHQIKRFDNANAHHPVFALLEACHNSIVE